MRLPLTTVLLGAFSTLALSQSQSHSFALFNADPSTLLDASEACLNAFSANVTCSPVARELFRDPFYDFNRNETWLAELCDSACAQSLTSHRNNVRSACAGAQYYDEFEDTRYMPWYLDEFMIYAYEIACMVRSDGRLCTSYLWDAQPSNAGCDECILKVAQRQVNSPFGGGEGAREDFASLIRDCAAGGYTTTTATSLVISSPIPATKTCGGALYTIQPTDDFFSIPRSQSVSTENLLNSNDLPYLQAEFPSTGTLCIENQCELHLLSEGDTCASIASSAGISQVQLRAWNPNINALCINLDRFIGNTFCISNPLGDYSLPDAPIVTEVPTPAPVPDDVAPEVNPQCALYHDVGPGDDCSTIGLKYSILLADFLFLNPGVYENCTNLWLDYSYCVQPVGDITTYPSYSGTQTTSLPPFTAGPSMSIPWTPIQTNESALVIPLANKTRLDCWDYIWINSTDPEWLNCWYYSGFSERERAQFALWNPSIDQNADDAEAPSYGYDCTLAPSVSYCIALASPTPETTTTLAPPSPRATGEIEGCIYWVQITEGDDCGSLLANMEMSIDVFFQMNPSVKKDCSGLSLGTHYCLSTDEIGLIDPGEDDESETPTITPTPTPTDPEDGPTPTPTQDGMTSNCNRFYLVEEGDGCWAIANNAGIALDDLYAWNPAVETDCGSLWPGYYICIGVGSLTSTMTTTNTTTTTTTTSNPGVPAPGPTQGGIPDDCNRWVMQQDGIFCYDMAAAAGISLDELYELNPALNGDCSGLWPGYAYCIGRP